MRREWDAIVVGASFAGLAAAMELRGHGRVLVLDKDPVGEHQTSACGTPLAVLERLQATAALEQVHEELVFHLPGGRVRRYRPAYAYATFDYRAFCRILAARTDAEIVQARVLGREAGRVRTSLGDFEATILIDASGWRSVLAARPAARGASAGPRTVGLEVALPRRGNGLHFWLGDELARDGYLW
ncbi:MAG: FAD-binding protein, partial [Candidatus Dormiibacterota bacterium]